MKLSDKAITQFWMELHIELQWLGIPMKRWSERAADVGWGHGYRILIDDIDRISCPDTGRFEFLKGIEPVAYAQRIQNAMRLTRTERQALELVRSGSECRRFTRRMVAIGSTGKLRWFRQATLDRLSMLGLVEEQTTNSSGTDVTFAAVQPRSVG